MKCVVYPKIYLVALLTCLIFSGCSPKKDEDFKNSGEYDKAMNIISNEISEGVLEQGVCTKVPKTTGGKLNNPIK